MKPGKLPPEALLRLLAYQGASRPEVIVGATLGEDSAIVDPGDRLVVLSTDPITGAATRAGWLAVHIACNDVAANGAEPLGVLITLLLATSDDLVVATTFMADVNAAARELGIAVLGGHTEVTDGLTRPIISVTAVGTVARQHYVTSAGARPGDVLILTKAAGLEGSAVLAGDFAEELATPLGPAVVERARDFGERLSVVPEGVFAARHGATAMHDVTEGGVLGAAYELARASDVGLSIDADRIPILPETRAICQHFQLDPLRLTGSGALLITAPPERALDQALAQHGISATVIGRVTTEPSVVWRAGASLPLELPVDELFRFLAGRASESKG